MSSKGKIDEMPFTFDSSCRTRRADRPQRGTYCLRNRMPEQGSLCPDGHIRREESVLPSIIYSLSKRLEV